MSILFIFFINFFFFPKRTVLQSSKTQLLNMGFGRSHGAASAGPSVFYENVFDFLVSGTTHTVMLFYIQFGNHIAIEDTCFGNVSEASIMFLLRNF